jgi:hypothetical protein
MDNHVAEELFRKGRNNLNRGQKRFILAIVLVLLLLAAYMH